MEDLIKSLRHAAALHLGRDAVGMAVLLEDAAKALENTSARVDALADRLVELEELRRDGDRFYWTGSGRRI